MKREMALKNGSRVAVIGGGPAGSFFAHFIQKYCAQKGIDISLTIFDGKDFIQKGPRGCNLCAGVLSESLIQKLNKEGIFIPEERIINRLDGYILHVDGKSIVLNCAENKKNKIATVFRGNGPRFSIFPYNISFDDYLLSHAQDKAAKVISHPVWDINIPEDKRKPLNVLFGERKCPQKFEADFIVGASGVNSYFMKKIQNLNFGYSPPSTLITYQAEYKLGNEKIKEHFGNAIHVYMPRPKNIKYVTVIPKGDYISITLAGSKDASKDMFYEFINLGEIRNKIPPSKPHCFCYPRIQVSPCKQPFTHRLVIIGDASFSRHYKNGIESAFMTAQLAARTAVEKGIDKSSLSFYYRKAKRLIVHDNYYGRSLFMMNDFISSLPFLTSSHLSLAKKGTEKYSSKKIRTILWNMFSGNIPYKEIFKMTLDIRLQFSLLINAVKYLIN